MSPARLVPLLSVLFSVFLFAPLSQAQVVNVDDTTSTPIAGAGHDYIHLLSETVSPANGSVSLRIQVPMPKGRGITIPFSFGYDSGSVHHLKAGLYPGYGSVVWASNTDAFAQGGWSNSLPTLRSDSWEQDVAVLSGYNNGQPVYTIYPCYYASNYAFRDTSAGVHSLGLGSLSWNSGTPPPSGCPFSGAGGPSSAGSDGQFGGTLTNSQSMVLPNPVIVYDEAGTTYSYSSYRGGCPIGQCFGSPDYIEDRNGNRALFTQNSVTDTLGRTLISGTGLGATGTTQTVSISGGLTYQLTWKSASASFSVPSTWVGQSSDPSQYDQCTPIPQANDTSTVVSQITLPNGQQYHFYHGTDNPNSNFQNPYGMLSEIDYPSGAWVRYTWKLSDTMNELAVFPGLVVHAASECGASPSSGCPWPVQDGCTYQYKTPVVATRTVGLAGSTNPILTQTFTYSTTWAAPANGNVGGSSWTQKTTSVTTTDNVTGKSTLTSYQYSPVFLPTPPFSNTSIPQQAPVESTIKYYDWGNTTTPLRTVNKTWLDMVHLKSQQTILENGTSSQTVYTYQSDPSGHFSQPTEVDEYDFGASSPTRKTITTYQSFSGTPGILADAPCKVVTQNGSSSTVAETDYLYDGGTSVCGTAGTPSVTAVSNLVANTHDETLFGAGTTTSRGNPTKIIKKCLQSCADETAAFTYDETGQILTKVDACGNTTCSDVIGTSHTTAYSYADNFDSPPSGNTNAYLTQITDPLGHISKFKYAFSDGQLIQSQDQNDISALRTGTTYSYNDSLRRLKETDYADGGKTTISYSDIPPSPSVTTSKLITASPSLSLSSTSIMDGLGRVTQTQLTTDPDGTDFTDIAYDGMNHVRTASNPHRSAALSTDGTTTYYLDALGRSCLLVPPDGTLPTLPGGSNCPASQPSNTVFTTYSGNCTTVTDQAGKARKSCSDGLGRLTQVFEDPAGLNYETDYTYDLLNNLLSVNQKGGSANSSQWRPRSFAYDSLSRLTSATNPESGTITYSYDANGNLTSKISPAPNQTGSATVTATYSYDALNRPTQKSFSNGTTPTIKYGYDLVALTGCSVAPPTLSDSNPIGRRTSMCDGAGAESWSHDSMGRILGDSRATNGVTKASGYTYNLDGSVFGLSYPGAVAVVNFTPGGAGRPLGAHNTSGWDIANTAHYAPNGSLCSFRAGWGQQFMHNYTFNNRFQEVNIQGWDTNEYTGTLTPCATTPNQFGDHFDLTYSYTDVSGHNNGNVQQMNNNLNMEITQLYTYDSLNRLATAETLHQNQPWWSGDSPTGACWSEQYTYDAWGNMSAISPVSSAYTGCTQESLSMTPTIKNQLQDTNNDFVYDAAGNLIQPGPTGGPYVFDAENHLISAGGMAYLYDGDGKRVGKAPASTPTQPNYLYWYGADSQILLETDGAGNLFYANYYFDGKILSRGEPDWVDHFYTDALGNVRVVYGDGDPDGGTSEYYPFGAERPIPSCCPTTPGGVGVPFKFTGKERDSESGLDNFGARFDSSNFGRFMSPDPNNAGASVAVPQSWNAYSYALNNPLNATDPTGLWCVWEDGTHDDDPENGGATEKECGQQGGHWDPTDTITSMNSNGTVITEEINVQGYLTDDDRIKVVAAGVGTLTSTSSLSEVGVNGFLWGQAGVGIAELPGAIGGVWSWLRAGRGAGEMLQGLAPSVSRTALEAAANAGGETVRVVCTLDGTPVAGRSLSVATGEGADALASAAKGGHKWVADIPKALIEFMRRNGLAEVSVTSMGAGRATATEINFLPSAVQFVLKYFRPA